MKYSFHPQAATDVVNAQDYYFEFAGAHVASRFTEELDRVVQLLRSNPGFGTPMSYQRRSYPLKGFPYSLVYRVEGEQLRVLIIRHQRQKPGYGNQRH